MELDRPNIPDFSEATHDHQGAGGGGTLSTAAIADLGSWAGSASITTLGTVATGTWQGTAIADAYISSAATWNAKQDAISFGTGVETALGISVGTAGSVVVDGGDAGTPSAIDLTNATNVPAPEGTAVLSTGEVGGTKFLREDGDGTSSWQDIPGGGDALTSSPLSQFAATTSLQLLGVISDETGSGSLVFATSPALVTPDLGTPSAITLTNATGLPEGQVTQHEGAIDHDALTNFSIGEHRVINDAGTSTTELWSASKIESAIAAVSVGSDLKDPAETGTVAGDGNITLSGEQTINGVLTSTSRVILADQTAPAENGLWVTAAGAWSRPADFDEDSEVTKGAQIYVTGSGSTLYGYEFRLTTDDPITVDTTGLTFQALRPLSFGTTSGTAAEGNDGRIPTQDENDALAGTGTPSGANVFVTSDTFTTHSTSTANPHSVTKSQVGLGSVENTALSTWAGSANITTLGTVSSGTVPFANVSGLDADLATFALPASTTISAFGATLVDDVDQAAAQATLGVDPAGTQNSTDVTIAAGRDYVTIAGQQLTLNAVDLAADVTGLLPDGNISSAAAWNAKVDGPASATDNALAMFDGTTGKLLKQGPFTYASSNLTSSDAVFNLKPNGGTGGWVQLYSGSADLKSPDGTNYYGSTDSALNLYTNNVNRIDINDSGMRMGTANARATTILGSGDGDSTSDTVLVTANWVKTFGGGGGGGGAFTADAATQITPTTAIVLDEATGNEAALTMDVTVNKATSGDVDIFKGFITDTAVPGTLNIFNFTNGGGNIIGLTDQAVMTLGPCIIDGANYTFGSLGNMIDLSGSTFEYVNGGGSTYLDAGLIYGSSQMSMFASSGAGGEVTVTATTATLASPDGTDYFRATNGTLSLTTNSNAMLSITDTSVFLGDNIQYTDVAIPLGGEFTVVGGGATLYAYDVAGGILSPDGTDYMEAQDGSVILVTNSITRLTITDTAITSTLDITVPDEAYGVGWNGSLEIPTKNAVYDKIETLGGGGNVSNTGTPADDQLAVWTDATTVEGASGLQWDSAMSLLHGDGNIIIQGSGGGCTGDFDGFRLLLTGGDLSFTEKADHTDTPSAGIGQLWVKSDTPNTLIFTDDAGTDHDLTTSGGGGGDLVSTNNLSDVDNAATAFGNIKQAATTSATGAVELATDGENAASKVVQGNDGRVNDGVITITIDGQGSAITAGLLDILGEIPCDLTITEVSARADASGSIQVDLWYHASTFPLTNTQSITASAPVTLSSQQSSTDSTLTGWTTALVKGGNLEAYVDSATTVKKVVITIRYTKT